MFKTVNALAGLFGALAALLLMVGLSVGAFVAYRSYHAERWEREETAKALEESEQEIERLSGELSARQEEILALNVDLKAKQKEIDRLDMALRFLKVDHRVAQLDVLEQRPSPESGELMTRVSFVEIGESGDPIEKPREFTVKGDVVHVAALVVKFADEHVEAGDPLRSTSLCLFKRLYGDKQEPEKGFPLDPVGSRPAAYRSGQRMSEWEQGLWSKFWDYANDPDAAKEIGIRAAHGEAVYQQMRPGMRYRVLLRSSGGLTIIPEDRPADGSGRTL